MSLGWSYPAGAENDPYAPYNQEEHETEQTLGCKECDIDYEDLTVSWSGNKRIGWTGTAECPQGHEIEVEPPDEY